jgi:hypothetical protein
MMECVKLEDGLRGPFFLLIFYSFKKSLKKLDVDNVYKRSLRNILYFGLRKDDNFLDMNHRQIIFCVGQSTNYFTFEILQDHRIRHCQRLELFSGNFVILGVKLETCFRRKSLTRLEDSAARVHACMHALFTVAAIVDACSICLPDSIQELA